MTTWAQFRADLLTAVKAVVPNDQVVWKSRERPFKKPGRALVLLNMLTFDFGQFDEERIDPDTMVVNRLGWRKTTISVRVEKHEQSDIGVALNTADQIATYLRSFNDQSSLNNIQNAHTIEYFEDDHEVSVCVFDMIWNVLIDKLDTAPQDYFQQVEVISDIEDETETLLPTPPNFDIFIPETNTFTLGVGADTLTDGADVLLDA